IERHVEAPMPGKVLEVKVASGDQVKAGDALLVLEAMKMENVLRAPRDGVVERVDAVVGIAVEKGAALVTYEMN
ncbi:MAG TPA: acetyl-CoA carboxylase biotin carboxyl carrier protein subunit, partial [Flavobacteriales bacterium]|nr:acetyl-CoA carboxylase biotin carboxyl carrier protein subunit [Flavobacteriales bacterium]